MNVSSKVGWLLSSMTLIKRATYMHSEEYSPRGCYVREYRLRLPGD